MATPRRGGSYNHYGERNQHFNKRQRPNPPAHLDRQRGANGPPSQQPVKPALSTKDMGTGMVALLDRFIADETIPTADRDVLHHARELRQLLNSRMDPKRSLVQELDKTRPEKVPNVAVPEYIERKVRAAKELPHLPPIAEPHLHEAVFTHRSAHVNPGDPSQLRNIDLGLDYERLELLGDAYIELIASRALYNRFPHVDVPELCSWRERLVENSTLGRFSEAYGFPDRLKHQSHWDTSSKAWQKVVADIFEAYVAALVLADPVNGFQIAEEWLTALWAPQLLNFKEKIIENPGAKNEMNKLLVMKDVKIEYREERPMTYDSNSLQRYFMGVYLTGWGYEGEWLGSGEGQNKNQAAVLAATDAMKRNSAAFQKAVQQKADIMAARNKARDEAAKAENEADKPADSTTAAKDDLRSAGIQDVAVDMVSKKSGNHPEDASVENADKKRKRKEKKEKKCKASLEGDSS
ncbi:ribonuclease III [Pyrenochaeta sp. DS3sAY3a]|nr:ribonuclease III [Pyrenochaeta sp. DS3sAY3a]